MSQQLLYSKLAKYYDLIYNYRDYLDEAVRLQNLIIKNMEYEANTLLDVACGSGLHLKHLKDDFSCTGVDVSPAMVRIAKSNVNGVSFKEGDMKDLKLGKLFDVVTCLFGSIGYVKTLANIERVILSFFNHLKPKGLLLIETSNNSSAFVLGEPRVTSYDGKNVKVARINHSNIRLATAVINMHILVAEKGKDVNYLVDKHELGLFGDKEMSMIMKECGFKGKVLKSGFLPGRELLIGIKN
jgi:ubiquinone/menaquinone biosynthesis C-methylase UbiE